MTAEPFEWLMPPELMNHLAQCTTWVFQRPCRNLAERLRLELLALGYPSEDSGIKAELRFQFDGTVPGPFWGDLMSGDTIKVSPDKVSPESSVRWLYEPQGITHMLLMPDGEDAIQMEECFPSVMLGPVEFYELMGIFRVRYVVLRYDACQRAG